MIIPEIVNMEENCTIEPNCSAPKENPKIAIAVFVENGYWGTRWAAPIASLMMEKYLKKEIKRKYLENYILKGNLMEEYKKPYLKSNFKINE